MSELRGQRTIVVRLTPTGRAAIAVVQITGPRAVDWVDAEFSAANGKPLAAQRLNRICFGLWKSDGEELVVTRRDDESVEIHCHGGAAAVAEVIQSLVSRGAVERDWPELVHTKQHDRIAAEATIALAEAPTLKTASYLLQQRSGALCEALLALQARLRNDDIDAAIECATRLLNNARIGLHLTRPWRVAICGRPNVGKSSLVNALLGFARTIVVDQPGTTRDAVTASTVMDGWPIELVDSAGLRDTSDPLEQAGIQLATRLLREVDLRLLVIDQSAGSTAEDRELLRDIEPEIVAANKLDLAKCGTASDVGTARVVVTSAVTGEGLPQLMQAIVDLMVGAAPAADAPIPFTLAQQSALTQVLAELRAGRSTAALEALRSVL